MSHVVAVSPARLAPIAAKAIRRAFNGHKNIMTPDTLGYACLGGVWAVELGKGEGFRDRATGIAPDIFGVTVVRLDTFESVHELCGCFVSRDAAMAYLGQLDRLATYRSARKALVAAMVSARELCRRTANVVIFGAAYERQLVLRKSLAELRRAYAAEIARFGVELPAEPRQPAHRTRVVPHSATMGGKVAARMVAQPVQQAQARDTRADEAAELQPGLAIDRACLDCSPRRVTSARADLLDTAAQYRANGKTLEAEGDLNGALGYYRAAREAEATAATIADRAGMVPQPVQQQQARHAKAEAPVMPAPAHATEQDAYNAARIATAVRYTAHIRYQGAPQTLSHETLLGAGMLALIMHREIMVADPTHQALPTIYAITPDGAGYLMRISEWLPATLAELARRSAGTYEPHPAIARCLAITETVMARTGKAA